MARSRQKQKPQAKTLPASKDRERKIKQLLEDVEKSALEIAEATGLEVYIETDTRGKMPSITVRVVMREFLRNKNKQREQLNEQGQAITKRLEEEYVSGESSADSTGK